MLRQLMRSKIHRATVTQCDPHYVGSITIDADLLRAADIRPNELVHVLDIDNAARFETYVFYGESGSGIIGINGAAAKLVEVGHKIIIVAYGYLHPEELDAHRSCAVVVDDHNRVAQTLHYDSLLEQEPVAPLR